MRFTFRDVSFHNDKHLTQKQLLNIVLSKLLLIQLCSKFDNDL